MRVAQESWNEREEMGKIIFLSFFMGDCNLWDYCCLEKSMIILC